MSAFAKHGMSTAHINGVHSGTAVSATKPDQVGGLEPAIFLAQNAKVILISNLWQQVDYAIVLRK